MRVSVRVRVGVNNTRWMNTKNFQYALDRIKLELAAANITANIVEARATCVLSLMASNMEKPLIFRGELEGELDFSRELVMQTLGFQSIFIPKPYTIPFTELNQIQKFKISHRARAFRKMLYQISS